MEIPVPQRVANDRRPASRAPRSGTPAKPARFRDRGNAEALRPVRNLIAGLNKSSPETCGAGGESGTGAANFRETFSG